MLDQTIYVIGHKSPDLDSVAGAIAYAELKNKLNKANNYKPAIAGDINQETKYALEKFGFETPELLTSVKEKNLILVDHNEFSQAVDGIKEADIREVIDHHKVNFNYDHPITFKVLPIGSTCSIISQEFVSNSLEIDGNLSGLMLSAILIDTVITKSPTCTDQDVEIIKTLASSAQIDDWQAFGIDLFKIRASVNQLGADEIIRGDFKDFSLGQGKFGIGQVETADLNDFKVKEKEILNTLETIRETEGYHTTILFITDIIKEGSLFLIASQDKEKLGQIFEADFSEHKAFLPGIMSRKKQVAPKIERAFS